VASESVAFPRLTTGAVTAAIDRLQRAGYAQRVELHKLGREVQERQAAILRERLRGSGGN
jgi:DNA-binding MarR family transcriptional regulator